MTFIEFCEAVSDNELSSIQKDYLSNLYRVYREDPEGFHFISYGRCNGKTAFLNSAMIFLNEYLDHQYEGV